MYSILTRNRKERDEKKNIAIVFYLVCYVKTEQKEEKKIDSG